MQSDRYLKVVLTAIAVALAAIALKLWMPTPQQPTLGEFYAIAAIKDPDMRNERALDFHARMPVAVVQVQGTVDTEVKNEVEVRPRDPYALPGLPGLPGQPN